MTAARASVDHRVALADRDVQIELTDFPPGETVTVAATQVFRSSRWQAQATFRADAAGRVSIARQAPLSGTYTDVSAMIIDRIEPIALRIPKSPGAADALHLVLCKITASSGLVGYGECLCLRPAMQQSLIAAKRLFCMAGRRHRHSP